MIDYWLLFMILVKYYELMFVFINDINVYIIYFVCVLGIIDYRV